MTILIVLVGILLVFWLLGRIRLGAEAAYSEAGFFLTIKLGPKFIQILPGKSKKKDKPAKIALKKDGQSAADDAKDSKKNTKDTISAALRFLPLVGDAAGRLKRKISIDNLNLHVIWGDSDPADAAKGYGVANSAIHVLWPIVECNFNVKECDLSVDIDFEREKPEIIGDVKITITIGQCVSLVTVLGIKALKIYLGMRRDEVTNTENEKAVQE